MKTLLVVLEATRMTIIPTFALFLSQSVSATSFPDFDGNGTVDFPDYVQFSAKFGLPVDDRNFEQMYDLACLVGGFCGV